MALGFVGGVMNLAWMGLATLFMVIEKLPQLGHYVTKPMGFVLVAAGIAVLGCPLLAGG
jgi:predicted metal-binding membrane protein